VCGCRATRNATGGIDPRIRKNCLRCRVRVEVWSLCDDGESVCPRGDPVVLLGRAHCGPHSCWWWAGPL
jgi:hypothetical protein